MLLALDTATDRVSIAVHDGREVLAVETLDAARRHAEALTPAIMRVLAAASATFHQLTGVAVGVGPGAFTGLRVGLATARTLAFARGLPCYGVLTLDALASAALDDGTVGTHESFGVALDARRREVFWARYEASGRVTEPAAGAPSDVAARDLNGLTVIGDASERYPDVFPGAVAASPSAIAVARIAGGLDDRFAVMNALPVYVRRPDAVEPGPRKPVTAQR